MSGWQDVPHDSDNPFGGVETPDGLVYAPQETSPELNWQPAETVPLPPTRERPQPRRHERAAPWKPGPDPTPVNMNTPVGRFGKVIVVSIIPLVIMAGLCYLVWTLIKAYGL